MYSLNRGSLEKLFPSTCVSCFVILSHELNLPAILFLFLLLIFFFFNDSYFLIPVGFGILIFFIIFFLQGLVCCAPLNP